MSPEPIVDFEWRVRKVSARSLGPSWRRGCPVPVSDLRSVSVRFWGFDHAPHTGVLILNRDVVKRTRRVFATMFERKFPLRQVRPVSEFKADDDLSMAADNTSAFNCRKAVAAGPASWSRHAYGRAIDVNPVENPYLFGKRVLPPAGRKFADRSHARRGLIRRADPIHRAFLDAGYRWGGDFSNPDYQHFDR
ncbi:MAG TPA: M15 family metallopeptidase [Kineosporiaceae bacterium]|nr:M15 family metallopeptidase [Kineosporiaceae bacterium]